MTIDSLYNKMDKSNYFMGRVSQVYRDNSVVQVENLSVLSHRKLLDESLIPNELLFVVETNSSFLNTEEEDKDFPLNIVNCIRLLSKKLSIKLKETVLDGRAFSRLGGICKALIIDMDD